MFGVGGLRTGGGIGGPGGEAGCGVRAVGGGDWVDVGECVGWCRLATAKSVDKRGDARAWTPWQGDRGLRMQKRGVAGAWARRQSRGGGLVWRPRVRAGGAAVEGGAVPVMQAEGKRRARRRAGGSGASRAHTRRGLGCRKHGERGALRRGVRRKASTMSRALSTRHSCARFSACRLGSYGHRPERCGALELGRWAALPQALDWGFDSMHDRACCGVHTLSGRCVTLVGSRT
jgi:hypothetical protein